MNIKNILSVRLIVVAVVTALIIALPILALVQEPAVAAPPPPLKGPFKFIELPSDYKANSLSGTALLTPTVIYSDTFASFVPVINPNLNVPGWQLFVNSGATDQKWGRILLSDSIFTNTLWSTGYYSPQQSAGSTYVPNMDTWVVYGPLNNNKFRQLQVQFDYYLDGDPGAAFGWAASADGQNFCGRTELSSHIGKWIRNAKVDLASCPGQSGTPVYVAFFFKSDAANPVGLGAFVDNVVISGVPWLNMYLPYVRRDPTPTASPTPLASATPLYSLVKSWDFNDPASDSSNQWCSGSTGDWSANKISIGGSTFYLLKVKQDATMVMQSPRYSTPTNYRITAQFGFLRFDASRGLGDYGSAQFGLIFGVDGDTFGTDPNPADRCPWDAGTGGYYKFMLKIKDGGGGYVTRLERSTNGDWTLLNESSLPSSITINRSDWNTIQLDRSGSGIVVYINNVQVLNMTDGTYKGSRWFGLFTQTLGNNRDGVFESDWDNIQIYNLTP